MSNSVAQCSCRLDEGVLGVLFSLAVEVVLTIILGQYFHNSDTSHGSKERRKS